MPLSAVAIANSALIKCGSDPISSLTQDTRRAILINSLFEQLRDEVQSAHPWTFTLVRDTLAPNSDEPDWGYTYVYDLPNGWLTLWAVDPLDLDYVVENDQILTEESTELNVLYGRSNNAPDTWSFLFGEALAWRIAAEIAYALTQSLNLVESCHKMYQKTIAEARWKDSVDSQVKELMTDKWIASRL